MRFWIFALRLLGRGFYLSPKFVWNGKTQLQCFHNLSQCQKEQVSAYKHQAGTRVLFHTSLAKKHSGGASFRTQKVCSSSLRVTHPEVPHTAFFLLCVVGPDPPPSRSLSSENRQCLACVPASAFHTSVTCLCQTAKDVSSQAKLKNAPACSWLHMRIVLMLVSTGSETDSEE